MSSPDLNVHLIPGHAAGLCPGCGSGSDSIGIVSNAVDVIEARKAAIGDGAEVRRLLPQRTPRTIGAWCFLDHYGPDEVSRGPGMQVPPHPHIGLQTVSWLFQGLVLHRDSLGSRSSIRPGELNLMTAGRGITHSEESAAGRPPVLHGLQLWIALPEAERHGEPRFAHHADLPVVRDGAANVTVAIGEYRRRAVPGRGVQPAGRVRGGGARRGRLRAAGPGGLRVRGGRGGRLRRGRRRAHRARAARAPARRACRRSGCHRPAGAGWPGSS